MRTEQKRQFQLLAPVIAGAAMTMLDMTGHPVFFAVSLFAGIATFFIMAVNGYNLDHSEREVKELERELFDLQNDYEMMEWRFDEARDELNELKQN